MHCETARAELMFGHPPGSGAPAFLGLSLPDTAGFGFMLVVVLDSCYLIDDKASPPIRYLRHGNQEVAHDYPTAGRRQ